MPCVTYQGVTDSFHQKNWMTDGQNHHWQLTDKRQTMDGRTTDRQFEFEVARRGPLIDSDLSHFTNNILYVTYRSSWNDFYELSCLFLKHNDEANIRRKLCRIYTALVLCTNDTMRCLCRFLHASYMSLMSLVNDIKLFVPNGISG